MTDTATQPTARAIERGNSRLTLTDHDGDLLTARALTSRDEPLLYLCTSHAHGVELDREQALALFHTLGDWIMATAPDKPEDPRQEDEDDARDYAWPAPKADTILDEAKAAVYGDRQADYGHPREDFTRTAIMWTGALQHLLADGQYVDAADVARCMILVKVARDVHSPKRDNRVDMAGYALTLDRLETGQ